MVMYHHWGPMKGLVEREEGKSKIEGKKNKGKRREERRNEGQDTSIMADIFHKR